MRSQRKLGFIILVLIMGAVVGTLLGELLGIILPEGVVKNFFIQSATFSFGPGELNTTVFTLTLGFALKLNIIGLIGILLAIYLLRWVINK